MAAHGHTATVGLHVGIGQVTQGWYAQVTARLAARPDAHRAALSPSWADAALDMVPPAHVDTPARALCARAL